MLRSFRSTILVFILTAALVPVLTVSIPYIWHVYASTRDGAVTELRLTAERLATEIRHELSFAASRFLAAAHDKDLALSISSPFFGTRATAIADEFIRESPAVAANFLLDKNYELIDVVPEPAGIAELGPLLAYIRAAMPDPQRYREHGLWLKLSDARLANQLLRVAGNEGKAADPRLLVLVTPLFLQRYSRQTPMEGLVVAVIPLASLRETANRYLARAQSVSLDFDDAPAQGARDDVQQAQARVEGGSAAGELPRLIVSVSEPNSVRFADLRRTLWLLCLLLVVAVGTLALAVTYLGRRLGRPLRELETLARDYAEGRYAAAPASSGFAEFRRVYSTLSEMGQRISRQLDELRNTNEQLQQADKLKDDFLASTSHELRTPLHGIIGIASSLLDGAAGDLSPKVFRNVRLIEQSGKRLETLVNDILDFSKIKNRALALELRPVELSSLVDIVLSLHEAAAQRVGLELVNEVPADLPPAWADEYRLQQVLHNLVGNAIKFTPEGTVTVRASAAAGELRLSVADTGIGIPAEKRDLIFDPFVQVEGSLTRRHAGTGLGLSISRQLVELHGGTLAVDCPAEGGTVFTLTLRAAEGEVPVDVTTLRHRLPGFTLPDDEPGDDADAPALSADSLPRHDASVLIVDDEPINLEILSNYFYNEPYTLHRASSGAEALEMLEAHGPVDLLLLDVMMPKMSGFEVCRRIRENPRFAATSILFLTAREQAQDIHQGFALGANDYLIKPISRVELLTRCRYHIHYGRVKNELALLNQSLEQKVEARTQELQETLAIIQRNSDVFRALLEISIELQGDEDLASSVGGSLAKLSALYPGRGFAVLLGGAGARQAFVSGSVAEPGAGIADAWAGDEHFPTADWLTAHDMIALPLIGPRRIGLGRMLAWPAALDQHEREVVELYGRQLSAVAANRRLQDELERIALTDALTGAFNRRYFEQTLLQMRYTQQRCPERHFGLISIDVNGLKTTNDLYGHEAGDALICAVVEMVAGALRQSDMVCRIGGDEFVILAQDATLDACEHLVARLEERQRQTRIVVDTPQGRLTLPVSFSIGYASSEETPTDALQRVADQRMYTRKQAHYASLPEAAGAPPEAL
ncbi:diguanylate cyclase [Niveibacterium microcysteis]|uniref:histidine kinase n=1 Tax=Niveibacterium microcysteis TaxID=2811415 RepID=A0ABX7M8I5_9RHOO|nr:diguanylate cyclase [Niveibacterium microcysteis]QSI78052.1 diguanylate cyclase [Niveibacterium microcysteis]